MGLISYGTGAHPIIELELFHCQNNSRMGETIRVCSDNKALFYSNCKMFCQAGNHLCNIFDFQQSNCNAVRLMAALLQALQQHWMISITGLHK